MAGKKKAGMMKAAARERKKAQAEARDLQRQQKLRKRAAQHAQERRDVFSRP